LAILEYIELSDIPQTGDEINFRAMLPPRLAGGG